MPSGQTVTNTTVIEADFTNVKADDVIKTVCIIVKFERKLESSIVNINLVCPL